MASTSTQSSSSTGGSYIPDYPQSSFLQQTAQYAANLAPQMLSWAQQAYAHNQQLTDDMIHQADLYSNADHIKSNMGMAEAGVAQASDAAMRNAQQDLQRYGIDPSSGRYADLDKASQVRSAAAKAGAGQQSRLSDEATARSLRSEGTNASLANANIGANMMRMPNSYLQTAMSLKYPPLGNKTQSQSSGGSNSSDPSKSGGKDSGGGGGSGPGGGGSSRDPGASWNNGNGNASRGTPGSSGANAGRSGVNNNITHVNPDQQAFADYQSMMDPTSPVPFTGNDSQYGGAATQDYWGAYDQNPSGSGAGDVWGTQDNTDPYSGWGDQFGQGATSPDGNVQGQDGNWNGDWGQNPTDNSNSNSYWDNTGGAQDNSGGQQDTSSYDTSQQDTSGFDNSSSWDSYDNSGDSGDYAAGGAVPASMSPSGGRQIDDVPAQVAQTGGRANINVDEFIIPRDVALWKGQEFFQNMIMKSRQALQQAPAKGRQGPPQGQQRPRPQAAPAQSQQPGA